MKNENSIKEKKGIRLELSRTALFFWGLGFFIFLGWIFTLGVLAGRGLLPSGAKTMAELKNQIAKLQEMIGRKDSSELEEIKASSKNPNFRFYDELSKKKVSALQSPKVTPAKKKPESKPAKLDKVKKSAQPSSARTLYVVQVASLDGEKQALNMVKRLVKKGYPAYHYKVFVKGRSYFRVRCGTFGTQAEAVETQKRLAEKERLKGFVQKVSRQQ